MQLCITKECDFNVIECDLCESTGILVGDQTDSQVCYDCMKLKSVNETERAHLRFLTALHGMQSRYSDGNSVCLSVRLSVRLSTACIVTKRKKNLSRFLYHAKDHSV